MSKGAKKKYVKYHNDGSVWAKGTTVGGVAQGYWEWFRCGPAQAACEFPPELVCAMQPFDLPARHGSRLKIAVTCPTTSASIPSLNSSVSTGPPG